MSAFNPGAWIGVGRGELQKTPKGGSANSWASAACSSTKGDGNCHHRSHTTLGDGWRVSGRRVLSSGVCFNKHELDSNSHAFHVETHGFRSLYIDVDDVRTTTHEVACCLRQIPISRVRFEGEARRMSLFHSIVPMVIFDMSNHFCPSFPHSTDIHRCVRGQHQQHSQRAKTTAYKIKGYKKWAETGLKQCAKKGCPSR